MNKKMEEINRGREREEGREWERNMHNFSCLGHGFLEI